MIGLRDRGLKQLFWGASLLALLFPALSLLLVYPQYQAHMLETVEDDARAVSRHLSHAVSGEAGRLKIDFNRESEPFLLNDFGILRLRVLDAQGRISYSTEPGEVGNLNRRPYFRQVLTSGRELTRIVPKGDKALGSEVMAQDVVETYLPLLKQGKCLGVFELYYDISNTKRGLNRIYLFSLLFPLPVMAIFLALVYRILRRMDGKIRQRQRDQEELEAQRNALLVEQERELDLLRHVEFAKKQWENTMDRVDDMVIVADETGRILRCNKALCRFVGQDFGPLLRRRLTEFFPGLSLAPGKTNDLRLEYRHDQSQRWFAVALHRAGVDENTERGLIVTLHDQTESKRLTEELEGKNRAILLSSQELQYAIDEISALIQRVVKEEDFGTFFANDLPTSCYQITKCGREDCVCYGKPPMRCWNETGSACGVCAGGNRGENYAQKLKLCANCSYFKTMTAKPISMIGEQFNSMMYILEGKNTELKQAYAELKQTQSHLLQHDKMASIGQLAAGVAHEINNPVGFIASNLGTMGRYSGRIREFLKEDAELAAQSGDAELAARQAESRKRFKIDFMLGDIDDLVRESLEGCERVKKIVQDLKGFSRVDQAREQTVDIHECIDSTVNIVWNELKYKTKVMRDYQASRPVTCFPQQLNQVFMNLLVNAAHAIEKEGIITIKTWQDEGFAYVSIADTGCGIPPENLSHIFEPFFTTKEVGKGTGLGLSIAYDIVTKNHHGEIRAESQVGQGTTFIIKLPCPQTA